jgi:hypothetical protein
MADQLWVCGPLWSSWHFRLWLLRRSTHIRISLEPWSEAPEERLRGIVHRRAALLLAMRGFALASGTFRLNLAIGFLDVVPPLRRGAGRFRFRRCGFDQGDRLRCIAQSGRSRIGHNRCGWKLVHGQAGI